MKKIALFLVIAVLIVPMLAHAEDITKRPIEKLGRGIANVLTCPFELSKGMGDADEEKGIFAAYTWGVLQGTVNIVKRAVVGVYEIVTFPIPLPKDYEPILTDPEYFLESEEYSGKSGYDKR
ncbi:MAG: exosortase system-associated protein, TIGR04073 family [Candidatus Omnitrophota bacterium]